MDKIKENVFWIGLAVAMGVLVAFGVLFVMPEMSGVTSQTKLIKSSSMELETLNYANPGNPVIGEWNKQREDYEKQFSEIHSFFQGKDEGLETYFEELPQIPPPRGIFLSTYSDRYAALENTLKEEGIVIGIRQKTADNTPFSFGTEPTEPETTGGFNWEEPELNDWLKIDFPEQVILGMQKRFWIRQRIANIAMKLKVEAIEDVTFFYPLYGRAGGNTSKSDLPPYVGAPSKRGTGGRETALPGNLGSTITFGFTIKLPYQKVGAFMREFLLPNSDTPELLIDLVGMRTYVPEQNPLQESPSYNEDETNEKEVIQARIKELTPKPVRLQLTCRVIDYDAKEKTTNP